MIEVENTKEILHCIKEGNLSSAQKPRPTMSGSRKLKSLKSIIVFSKCLISPTAYLIHCNLIDKNQNLLNNKKSDILAKFDMKGNFYEKVSYVASPQQLFRDSSTCSHVNSITVSVRDKDGGLFATCSYVNSITVSVRDKDGELFDFNGLPLEFELEIN